MVDRAEGERKAIERGISRRERRDEPLLFNVTRFGDPALPLFMFRGVYGSDTMTILIGNRDPPSRPLDQGQREREREGGKRERRGRGSVVYFQLIFLPSLGQKGFH